MNAQAAREILSRELDDVMKVISHFSFDPSMEGVIRAAILAGISSGVKLAAINDASAEHIAVPLCQAVSVVARSLRGFDRSRRNVQ